MQGWVTSSQQEEPRGREGRRGLPSRDAASSGRLKELRRPKKVAGLKVWLESKEMREPGPGRGLAGPPQVYGKRLFDQLC